MKAKKFDVCKLALAAATTMTILKVLKYLAWNLFGHRLPMLMGKMHMHGWHKAQALAAKAARGKGMVCPRGVCCPGSACMVKAMFMKLIITFGITFVAVWFLAWFYNTLLDKK